MFFEIRFFTSTSMKRTPWRIPLPSVILSLLFITILLTRTVQKQTLAGVLKPCLLNHACKYTGYHHVEELFYNYIKIALLQGGLL